MVAKETWASVARRIASSLETMTVQNLSAQPPFITKDGSTIRSILDRANAPVQNQSLAEARVPAGGRIERHYHKMAEELYFILEGAGEIELDGERHTVRRGDAILILSLRVFSVCSRIARCFSSSDLVNSAALTGS
jgi:quercetin dioxygenase-like cupin family protein